MESIFHIIGFKMCIWRPAANPSRQPPSQPGEQPTSLQPQKAIEKHTRRSCLCNEKWHPFLNPKRSPKCVSVVRNSLFVDPDYVGEKNWYSVSVRALNLPMPAKYTHVWKPIFSFMFCFEHIGACFWIFFPKLRASPLYWDTASCTLPKARPRMPWSCCPPTSYI